VERGEGFFGTNVGRGSTKPMPSSDASEIWRRECETINQEMESLILSDWPRSHEENQVRKIQFMAQFDRDRRAALKSMSKTSRDRIERCRRLISECRAKAEALGPEDREPVCDLIK